MGKKTNLVFGILKAGCYNYPCMVRIAIVCYVRTSAFKGRVKLTDIIGQHFANSLLLDAADKCDGRQSTKTIIFNGRLSVKVL